MSRTGRLHLSARWIALLAFALATLAPSMAHALRHARGETMPWSLLCSATGSMRVITALDDDGNSVDPGVHPFEPCPCCTLHHDGAAPPAAAAQFIAEAIAGLPLPARVSNAARPQLVWSGVQPRAPPSHA
jgi:Protein of unknown function (DUF2946)